MTSNERLARLRRAAGISQGRLAKRAGVSQTLVSQFEIGNISLRPDRMAALEDALRRELARSTSEIQRLTGDVPEEKALHVSM